MNARLAVFAVSVAFVFSGCGPQDAEISGNDWVDDSYADQTDEFDTVDQALNAGVLDSEEVAFLGLINQYRVSKGLGKLKVSIALTRASDAHNKDMIANNFFSHDSSNGDSFSTRVKKYYPCNCWLGENIAVGYDTAASVFAAWKASPGHDANMRGENYKVLGIARTPNADGRYYWTTDFGSDVDAIFSAGLGSIINNGGFESDAITTNVAFSSVRTLSRWHTQFSSGGGASRSTAAAASSSYGMRLTDPDPGHTSATQVVRAAANVNYRVSAMARKNSGATQQTLYLDFLDASFARIKVVTAPATTTNVFTAVKVEEVAPAGTRYVRVILWGSGATGHKSQFDWDVVRVEAW
jgi:uncharacterized protein YkwD